jgi:hypothetical protein
VTGCLQVCVAAWIGFSAIVLLECVQWILVPRSLRPAMAGGPARACLAVSLLLAGVAAWRWTPRAVSVLRPLPTDHLFVICLGTLLYGWFAGDFALHFVCDLDLLFRPVWG